MSSGDIRVFSPYPPAPLPLKGKGGSSYSAEERCAPLCTPCARTPLQPLKNEIKTLSTACFVTFSTR